MCKDSQTICLTGALHNMIYSVLLSAQRRTRRQEYKAFQEAVQNKTILKSLVAVWKTPWLPACTCRERTEGMSGLTGQTERGGGGWWVVGGGWWVWGWWVVGGECRGGGWWVRGGGLSALYLPFKNSEKVISLSQCWKAVCPQLVCFGRRMHFEEPVKNTIFLRLTCVSR